MSSQRQNSEGSAIGIAIFIGLVIVYTFVGAWIAKQISRYSRSKILGFLYFIVHLTFAYVPFATSEAIKDAEGNVLGHRHIGLQIDGEVYFAGVDFFNVYMIVFAVFFTLPFLIYPFLSKTAKEKIRAEQALERDQPSAAGGALGGMIAFILGFMGGRAAGRGIGGG